MRAPARLRHARASGPRRRVLGVATLGAGHRAATGPRCCELGAPLRVRRAARRDRRVRGDGVGAVRARLLDQVRRRQRRARDARASTRSPRPGRRSRARSCCGRSRCRSTSRSPRGGSARAPTIRSSRGRRSCSSSCCCFFFALMLFPANPFKLIARHDPARRAGPEPAAAEPPARRDPPADALRRLRRVHDPVLVRDRGARHRPVRRRLARRRAAHDARRVGLPHGRHRARRVVELRGARLGRLLGLGPGRERVAAAVAHRDRVHPLGDGAGTARDAARLEPVARDRDVLPDDPRHVPHALGRRQLGARVQRSRRSVRGCSRSSASCAVGGVGLIAWRGDKLRSPGRIDSPVSREAAFLLNNLLFAALRARRAHRHGVPAARRGAAGQAAHGRRAVLRAARRADRARAAVPDGGRSGAAVAGRERRAAAQAPADPGVGRRRSRSSCACSPARRGIAKVLAFALGAFALASVGRSVGHRRARPPARDVGSVPDRDRPHGARATRGSTAGSSCTSASSCSRSRSRRRRATRPSARCSSSPGESATVRGFTVTYLGTEIDATRAEDDDQRPTCASDAARRDLGVYAPAISTFPNFPDGHRHAGGPHRLRGTTCTSRSCRRRRATRRPITLGVQIGTMVMWLWIGGVIMALGTAPRAHARAPRDAPVVADRAPRRDEPRSWPRPRRERGARIAVDRARRRPWCSSRSASCSRCSTATRQSVPRLVQEHKRRARFDLRRSTASRSSSTSLAGKTVVVNFWNTWCIPCRQEAAGAQGVLRAHRDEPDFAMVGIVRDDDRDPCALRRRATTSTWPVAFDPTARAGARLRDDRPARDLRDLADGCRRVRQRSGRSPTAELEAWLRVARAGGVCA